MKTDILDLDLLRTFQIAADFNSFAKAADLVARSQSAVSLQMQRLEELIGHKLFIKQGRSWQLTASGELLLHYSKQLLELNDQAIQALTEAPLVGQVRLGMRTDFSEGELPVVLTRFKDLNPKVQIEIIVDRQEVLLKKLASGKLDVVATFDTKASENDNAIPIGKVPLRWIGNTNKTIAQQRPLPLLLFEQPCPFRSAGLEALEKASIPWRPILTASSVSGMWAAAHAGLGITVRSEIGLPAGCQPLSPKAGLPPLPDLHVFLLTPAKKPSPAAAQMIAILQETLSAQLQVINGKRSRLPTTSRRP